VLLPEDDVLFWAGQRSPTPYAPLHRLNQLTSRAPPLSPSSFGIADIVEASVMDLPEKQRE
jgi:hypothetical protein